MIDFEVVKKLKSRYNHIHPLLFSRSVERAKSPGDLYDILETIPNTLPLVWNENKRRWIEADDITLFKGMEVSEESE